ncbi:acetyl-CoA carboxylase biotin carboxyl carrier protein subunit [Sinomicrobium sp. M5D2P9]
MYIFSLPPFSNKEHHNIRTSMDKTYNVNVNDTFGFTIDTHEAISLDMVKTGQESFHVLKDHKSSKVQIVEADFLRKTYRIRIDGTIHRVKISDDIDRLIEEMGFTRNEAEHISDIKAPMPGLVLDIQVKEGQDVLENDTLVVLEAMKMENVILSPRNGVIKSIVIQKGSSVDKGQLLLEYE